jgi:hypothetical protein
MAAPKGNQFWKLAKNPIGTEKAIPSPEHLWEKAQEYFQWCDDNPLHAKDWVGKDAKEVYKELMRPYTIGGLATYLGISERGLWNYGNREEYKEYFPIHAHISQIIRTQKFEGAAVGLFNAGIIARDLGLVDKVQSENTNINQNINLTKEEFKNLSDELDGEY